MIYPGNLSSNRELVQALSSQIHTWRMIVGINSLPQETCKVYCNFYVICLHTDDSTSSHAAFGNPCPAHPDKLDKMF